MQRERERLGGGFARQVVFRGAKPADEDKFAAIDIDGKLLTTPLTATATDT